MVIVVYLHEALERKRQAGKLLTNQDVEDAAVEGAVFPLHPKLMSVCAVLASPVPVLREFGIDSPRGIDRRFLRHDKETSTEARRPRSGHNRITVVEPLPGTTLPAVVQGETSIKKLDVSYTNDAATAAEDWDPSRSSRDTGRDFFWMRWAQHAADAIGPGIMREDY